jgi:hypothetical protein
MARRRGCVLASCLRRRFGDDPLCEPSGCDWHVFLQNRELRNQQPHQGKKPGGTPRPVPCKTGRPRSGVESSSTEVGFDQPIEPMTLGNMRTARAPSALNEKAPHEAGPVGELNPR